MAAPRAAPCCLGNMRILLSGPRGLRAFLGPRACGVQLLSPLSCLPLQSLLSASCPALLSLLSPGLGLYPDFISEAEEAAFCGELEPGFRRKRYESGHWDEMTQGVINTLHHIFYTTTSVGHHKTAIHGFRETERLQWSPENAAVLQRVRDTAFPPGEAQLSFVHVLDLQKEGYIKPHVDSVKFCGTTIAGLCLLSSSVMRLVSVDKPEERADLLLPRRCLYVLSFGRVVASERHVGHVSVVLKMYLTSLHSVFPITSLSHTAS